MRVNACGKDCAACGEYAAEKCGGCGAETTALCAIARCAEKKCFDKCSECWKNDDCKKLTQKGEVPALRREELCRMAQCRARTQENAATLRRWLTVLAFLPFVRGAGVILSVGVADGFAALQKLGGAELLIAGVCLAVYGAVLLLLGRVQAKYLPAGLCILLSGVAAAVQPYLGEGKLATLAVPILVLLLSSAGEYYECKAHADTALGADYALAEKWGGLWKWMVGAQTVLVLSVLLIGVLGLASLVLMLGSGLALLWFYRRKGHWIAVTVQSL